MRKDAAAVRALVKDGKDVNAAQGDGMTALHWAAMHGDADLTSTLLNAGANVKATTRLGGYTALHLAAQAGEAAAIARLIAGGANPGGVTSTGATPLMLASASGNSDAVKLLLEQSADANAAESANGETALMFAAALDRSDAVRELLAHGADPARTSKAVDLTGVTAPEETLQNTIRDAQNAKSASVSGAPRPAAGRGAGRSRPRRRRRHACVRLQRTDRHQGGLTALHFAARQAAAGRWMRWWRTAPTSTRWSPGDGNSLLDRGGERPVRHRQHLLAHGAIRTWRNAGGVVRRCLPCSTSSGRRGCSIRSRARSCSRKRRTWI
jgi:hypothetical protein